ncbi:MAG TPA: FecR domain-containing protein [Sphingobacterium sp.]|nr:FecR domain-containing protein [Sphingobacterium sp.]
MDKSEIRGLFERYKRGDCTEEDIQLLYEWLVQGNFEDSEISEAEVLEDLKQVEALLPLRKSKSIRKLYRIATYAASVMLILGLGYYYQSTLLPNPQQIVQDEGLAVLDPGSNKAILRLSDGSSLVLDSLHGERLLEIDGALVQVNGEGQLVYLSQQTSDVAKNNQIITPKGGQYEVILPDGTHVWLNSESKLSFVNNFDNLPERQVVLEGEAYFEVSHNATQPFVVSVNGQHVKVLGTEFNVNAYAENKYIKTSLVEGSVLFNESRLKPGESALFQNNKVHIRSENMDDIVAWKNGYFVFFEESLEEAMKKISRWYDLDVSFVNEQAKTLLVGGSISKYENALKVFEMIEKAGDVKITVQGRKILINKI